MRNICGDNRRHLQQAPCAPPRRGVRILASHEVAGGTREMIYVLKGRRRCNLNEPNSPSSLRDEIILGSFASSHFVAGQSPPSLRDCGNGSLMISPITDVEGHHFFTNNASDAVNPCKKFRSPMGPISPLQKNPASPIGPNWSCTHFAS